MSEKEEFTIRIGPLLKAVLEQQKKQIKQATYDCVEPSDYEAGEIIAKKITNQVQ